jgi:IS30 family transposase
MEVSEEVVFNTIIDWKKKDLDPYHKAELLTIYMKNRNLSQRECAAETGLSRTTIQRILVFNRLSKTEYDGKKSLGMTKEDIIQEQLNPANFDPKLVSTFDVALDRLLNQSRKQNFFTAKTLDRVVRLRSELARIISEINAQNG